MNETRTLGSDLNTLVDLPADFKFPVEINELPWRNVYCTPKPPARSIPRWNRSFERWSTRWTFCPVTQPCQQYEHRLQDLPAEEPTFLSYLMPWEISEASRYYFRLPKADLRAARKTEGRLAHPGYFPYEARRIASPHEIECRKALLKEQHSVLGWKEGGHSKPYSVPRFDGMT